VRPDIEISKKILYKNIMGKQSLCGVKIMNSGKIDKSVFGEISSFTVAFADEPMHKYTTFKTGGPADILVCPQTPEEIKMALDLANGRGIPYIVIGGGSNLLVSDAGIRGIVIRICADDPGGSIREISAGIIHAGASVKKSDFIDFCLERGYGGIQFMAGIPGVLGGGIVMNAGTTMGSFVSIIKDVEYVTRDGRLVSMPVTGDMASYRKFHLPEGAVIAGGTFTLPMSGDPASVGAEIEAIKRDRESKHPLEYPSAGSVFKNPPGHSSWRLIQEAGLKGKRLGGAMISEKHTNFIINVDNATSQDIRDLIELTKEEVYRKVGVELEAEIRLIGDFR